MNKLKVFGILASAAGFAVSLVASAIDDKKMEEAVDKAVDEKLKLKETEEVVSDEKEFDLTDYTDTGIEC